MNYEIKIPQFEGPLDLLLHLIRQDDIDIFDISINRITEQYLNYLNIMQELNLDIASEYLVMASELIEMKSRNLLPSSINNDDDDYEDDSKERLIQRLLEYEQYKQITPTLHHMESLRKDVFTRDTMELLNYKDDEKIDYGVNIDDLINAFQAFINRQELDKPINTKIEHKEYSVKKRCAEIKTIIKEKKKILFTELFEHNNKNYIVVTFLAVLSMAKKQEIKIEQNQNFNEIIVKEYENE